MNGRFGMAQEESFAGIPTIPADDNSMFSATDEQFLDDYP